MRALLIGWNWRQMAPRIAADIVMVELAALAALASVVMMAANGAGSTPTAKELWEIYGGTFLPLTPIFPFVFLVRGLYTRSRAYPARYKWVAVSQAATLASLLFLFASFVLNRAASLPRSGLVLFLVLVNALMIGARLIKHGLQVPTKATTAEREMSVARVSERDVPVLVVGGGGYIGSILCRRLLDQGRRVRLLDSFVYGNGAVRELFGHPRFELQIGDCRNIQSVVSAMNGVESVVHLAAIVGDPACEQDRKGALEINYAATRMMTEIAKGYGVQRFLFASSCSVYGETEELVDERSVTGPISLYAQTKVDSEIALLKARTDRFHPGILRLATVFGNSYRPRFDLVVNLLTAKAIRDGVITIYNGEQWRPFIHVSDVAEGFLKALSAPLPLISGEIYNLGDSRLNYTLSDVASTIARLVPGTRIEHIENPDRRNYRVCFDKVRDELEFQCRVTLEEGIRDLKAALESRQINDYADPLYHNQRFLKGIGELTVKEATDSQVIAAFAITLENLQHAAAQQEAARP